ncbi:transcriptional regulator, LysR family [Shewanella halifaxensis HAW-EB4]|uniref:Transcriptional regulator, LysR family n=1 Tax=Shewanella halifaxensis (strain HAW-EB4) TaxID=458817 RepID=B0TRN2_SHEHH|nr:LysR family transcriptional regulator [Shewanella halifaxensis]ABZ76450.1 transcriptional regulator, LysR family [Shewanella halifaxensis HAW-EB4]
MEREIDLNLLKMLVLLNKYRNMKLVGRKLGKTESAISKSLSRLREHTNDKLFVRGAAGLEPTEFTSSLIPKITQALDLIDDAFLSTQFDPKEYKKPITIALNGITFESNGTEIYQKVHSSFPNAEIRLQSWSNSTKELIIEGEIDIGIQLFDASLNQSISKYCIEMKLDLWCTNLMENLSGVK